MTEEQLHNGYEGIMEHMVKARWLEQYTFTVGKGFHLVWTGPGAQHAVLLKHVAESFMLDSGDSAPMLFDEAAHGDRLIGPNRFPIEGDVADFWCDCIAKLGVSRDEDSLLFLVHTILGWAPDAETRIKFGIGE